MDDRTQVAEEIEGMLKDQEKSPSSLAAVSTGILMDQLLREMRDARPSERSELSRRYAVAITEMEKVYAYFKTYVIDGM